MGRGDARTRKGKIFRSSYGLTRKKRKAASKKTPASPSPAPKKRKG
ncbi:MAG: 30S ribosomal protein THX [Bdellovibrionota bacterium]|nr:MAG: 30S ribosomal protein THX [Bdellovibrionota bacterium]